MPLCPYCRTIVGEDNRFCPECGRSLAGGDVVVGEAAEGKSKKKLIRKARTGVGRFVQVLGFIVWLGCGIATCVFIFGTIADAAGTWVAVIGFVFFPFLFGLAPLVHWLITGTFPLLYFILWGIGWGAMLIVFLGGRITGED